MMSFAFNILSGAPSADTDVPKRNSVRKLVQLSATTIDNVARVIKPMEVEKRFDPYPFEIFPTQSRT